MNTFIVQKRIIVIYQRRKALPKNTNVWNAGRHLLNIDLQL